MKYFRLKCTLLISSINLSFSKINENLFIVWIAKESLTGVVSLFLASLVMRD